MTRWASAVGIIQLAFVASALVKTEKLRRRKYSLLYSSRTQPAPEPGGFQSVGCSNLSASEAKSNVKCKPESPRTWGQIETVLRRRLFVCFTAVCGLFIVVCLQTRVWYYMQSYSVECYNFATFYLLDTFENGRKKSQLPFWPLSNLSTNIWNHCCTFGPLRWWLGDFHCILLAAMIVCALSKRFTLAGIGMKPHPGLERIFQGWCVCLKSFQLKNILNL